MFKVCWFSAFMWCFWFQRILWFLIDWDPHSMIPSFWGFICVDIYNFIINSKDFNLRGSLSAWSFNFIITREELRPILTWLNTLSLFLTVVIRFILPYSSDSTASDRLNDGHHWIDIKLNFCCLPLLNHQILKRFCISVAFVMIRINRFPQLFLRILVLFDKFCHFLNRVDILLIIWGVDFRDLLLSNVHFRL